MTDKNEILDEQLKEIAGGVTEDEIYDIFRGLSDAANSLAAILQHIKTAAETNTCPICNEQIIPGASRCEYKEVIQHVKLFHYSK